MKSGFFNLFNLINFELKSKNRIKLLIDLELVSDECENERWHFTIVMAGMEVGVAEESVSAANRTELVDLLHVQRL